MINIQFIDGPISAALIMGVTEKYSTNSNIGAHSSFVGQIREDHIDHQKVASIKFTSYKEMALKTLETIANKIINEKDILYVDILHSLGDIKVGEICMYISIAGGHRKQCLDSIGLIVEKIKKEVPIFGEEIFHDGSHQWKVNK